MATVLVIGKKHIRTAKVPQYSRHRFIEGSNQHTLAVRALFNRRFGLSTQGIARLGNINEPYDVIHCLNDIPFTDKPWIVTFEDILPRTFGSGGKTVGKLIRHRLLSDNCLKLVGQSKYALGKLARATDGWKGTQALLGKATVIYPSIELQEYEAKDYRGGNISLVFCGRQFARKGGVSAVRLAKLAHDRGLPVTIHIVSDLRVDAYTDFTDPARYEPDLALLGLPNVVHHSGLNNRKVLELLQTCEFQYMPTIGDTFGFSVVEGLSVGTPAIVSNTCAMPELVKHNESGYLLDVDINEQNDIAWLRSSGDRAYRGREEYWEKLDHTYSDLASQAFDILDRLVSRPSGYEALSAGALAQATQHHDARKMSQAYDRLYDEALTSA